MKTVIFWDTCGQDPLSFFIVDGDYSHLDGIFINHYKQSQELQDALNGLIHNEDGQYKHKQYKKPPRKAMANLNNKIIVAGFLP
jgi:hypothetical protein